MSSRFFCIPLACANTPRAKDYSSSLLSTSIVSFLRTRRRPNFSRGMSLLTCAFCIWIAASGEALAQPPQRRTIPLRYEARLASLTHAAGAIFSGTVMSVHRIAAKRSGEVETVEISFRVEHAIQGTQAGQRLTIREWAGLWTTGERYHVGDRLMLFLYPPSKLGLTSPVGGPEGPFALEKNGQVTIGNWSAAAGQRDAEPSVPATDETVLKNRVTLREFAQAIRRAQER